ncbi:MAG: glycosyltransferase [Planctomycetes bacterium]|nr:glycosyltransferase [Planctomycetota bacterium]
MCRLSIIVPFLGNDQFFEDTLVSVLQNRPARCEVMVVHRGRYDDPYELQDEVTFVQVGENFGMVEAINAGIKAAEGEIVHLIQPGVLADDGWIHAAVNRFHDPAIAAVAPLVLDAADSRRVAVAGIRFARGGRRVIHGAGMKRSKAKRLLRSEVVGPALMAAFYRRSAVMALGGLCADSGPWYADVDLGLSLRHLGFRCELEPESVMTTLDAKSAPPSNFEPARCAERVFWRHWRQNGGAAALLAHAAHVTATLLVRPHRPETYGQLAGRMVARLERSTYRQHQARLQRACETEAATGQSPSEADDPAVIFDMSEYRRRSAA